MSLASALFLPRVGWEISAEGKLRKWSAAIPTGEAELFISRWPRGRPGP